MFLQINNKDEHVNGKIINEIDSHLTKKHVIDRQEGDLTSLEINFKLNI